MVEIGHILRKPIHYIVFKAERINAIRKQFSSLVEEDKKRKSRNEYILESLDKIRTSSAIVQVRNAPQDFFATVNQNRFPYHPKDYTENNPMSGKSRLCLKNVDNTNAVTTISEEEMLREICQKYILIPRHSSLLEYDDNYLLKYKLDDSSDWRMKYRILEQLKQKEKEDEQKPNAGLCKEFTTINVKDGEVNHKKIEEPNLQTQLVLSEFNKNSSEKNEDNLGTTGSPGEVNDNVEINIPTKKPDIATIITNNSELNEPADLIEPTSESETENLTRNTDIITQVIPPVTTPTSDNVNDSDKVVNEHHAVVSDELTQKEKIQTRYEMEIKPKEEVIQEKVQYSNIDAKSQILTETSNIDDTHRKKNILNYLHSEDKLSVNEPLAVENINMTVENTDYEEAKIEENPLESQEVTIVYPVNEELDETGVQEQIDEFEAEQTEMLYSDPNVMNYAYDQAGTDGDYAYYEGTEGQEGQIYVSLGTEHDETIDQYDHNYESQYGESDLQEQLVEDQYDVFDVEERAPEPELYEQIQFGEPDYNVVEEVESELDAEQNLNFTPASQEENKTNIIDEAILPEGDSNVENSKPTPVT